MSSAIGEHPHTQPTHHIQASDGIPSSNDVEATDGIPSSNDVEATDGIPSSNDVEATDVQAMMIESDNVDDRGTSTADIQTSYQRHWEPATTEEHPLKCDDKLLDQSSATEEPNTDPNATCHWDPAAEEHHLKCDNNVLDQIPLTMMPPMCHWEPANEEHPLKCDDESTTDNNILGPIPLAVMPPTCWKPATNEEHPLKCDDHLLDQSPVTVIPPTRLFKRRWLMVFLFACYSMSNAYQWIHLNIIFDKVHYFMLISFTCHR